MITRPMTETQSCPTGHFLRVSMGQRSHRPIVYAGVLNFALPTSKRRRWAVGPIKAGENLDIIKSLKEQGRSVREIAKRTGLSKSTVQRKLNDHPADD
jgi:transcriptional regulator of acetoin/glycerol metabolism